MAEENKTEETVVETQAQEASAEDAATNAPDLNVNDLAALRNILEVATQRGAFKANELEAVGKVFNKLDNFLNAVANNKEE